MYLTLYRKWRPKTFDDVSGQDHVTEILRYELSEGKTSHAYLFCGTRGTGKTTCAKILAKALNCESPVNGNPCGHCSSCTGIENGSIIDVIEMDAASNNSVDDIRDIRESVDFVPTEVKKRVYIIDEVHMLSQSAFNALLKTLEEPPEHAVFILATTELQKIPATILSRCQRFDFRRIDASVITARLRTIADAEGFSLTEDALFLIARVANGGMRDAIGMLELCATQSLHGGTVDEHTAAALIGVSDLETMSNLVACLLNADYNGILKTVDTVFNGTLDAEAFWENLQGFYRDLFVVKTAKQPELFLDMTDSQVQLLRKLSDQFSKELLFYHIKILDDTYTSLQANRGSKRVAVETGLVRMCDRRLDDSPSALLARIEALEAKLAGVDMVKATSQKEEPELPADKPQSSAPLTESTKEQIPQNDITQETQYARISQWPDIIGSGGIGPGLGALLKKARASLSEDGTKIRISAKPAILSMIENDASKQAILSAMRSFGIGEKLKHESFIWASSSSDEADNDPFEDLESI